MTKLRLGGRCFQSPYHQQLIPKTVPTLATAADLLPAEPWTEDTWSAWTAEIKARTGRKGRALFQPLRRALTGLDHGPELKRLLPLIGRQKADARLRGGTA